MENASLFPYATPLTCTVQLTRPSRRASLKDFRAQALHSKTGSSPADLIWAYLSQTAFPSAPRRHGESALTTPPGHALVKFVGGSRTYRTMRLEGQVVSELYSRGAISERLLDELAEHWPWQWLQGLEDRQTRRARGPRVLVERGGQLSLTPGSRRRRRRSRRRRCRRRLGRAPCPSGRRWPP